MNGFQLLGRTLAPRRVATDNLTFDDVFGLFNLENALFPNLAALRAKVEIPDQTFAGFTAAVYGRSPIAFAALMTRWKLFSQARFQWQQMFGGRRGALYGTPKLALFETPEPGETTVDMLIRAISDADLEGDYFGVYRDVGGSQRVKRIRPDWTTVVLGSKNPDVDPRLIGLDPDTEVLGYGYVPGGPASYNDVITFGVEEVIHWHPNVNPLSRYRGLPLILAALKEVTADQAATTHKLAFFNNAATPSIAFTMPDGWDEKRAKSWIDQFERKNTGKLRAYRTIYFNAGMKAEKVGTDFQQMTFKELQGTAETRLAAVTGMHPVVVGFSEGLQGSSLNAGNFQAAARIVADVTLRWLWTNFCGSAQVIMPPPGGSRLWYDEEAIPFLQASVQDKADVMQKNGSTINAFIQAGFEPDSAVDAVMSGDYTRLVHTGLPSIQLQPAPVPTQPEPSPQEGPTPYQEPADKGAAPPAPPAAWRARGDFWPIEGRFHQYGRISEGRVLPASHPLVLAFPSMFDEVMRPAPRQLAAGPIVTRGQVLAKRAELAAAGKPTGYEALARALQVSAITVRRRLAEATAV